MTDYSRGYRAGLEAAAKAICRDVSNGYVARRMAETVRALPVPGEVPDVEEMRAAVPRLRKLIRDTDAQTTAAPPAEAPDLRGLLADCVGIVDKAGLLNLSNGVQLGQTVWYVHASDIFNRARAALAAQPEGQAALAQEPGPDDGRDTSGGARRKPGPAAASGSSGGNVAHAAAPGGEDAEALLRECRDVVGWRLQERIDAWLAARAGGSRG